MPNKSRGLRNSLFSSKKEGYAERWHRLLFPFAACLIHIVVTMKTIKYDVRIFTDNIEESAIEQIKALLSVPVFSQCKIRIMPDVHAGAGCVIGFTGNLGERVIPNIVGVDIGCGIYVQPFACSGEINYHALNEFILRHIPSGRNYRDEQYAVLPPKYIEMYSQAKGLIKKLRCYRELKD